MVSEWRALRRTYDSHSQGDILLSESNIEAKAETGLSPAYFGIGLEVAPTVIKNNEVKVGRQSGNVSQKPSQNGPLHEIFVISVLFSLLFM